MTIFTIGFTKKSAAEFFNLLRNSNVRTLYDVRTNNSSQLAGFAKKQDLSFFLKEILNVDYVELRELCPEPNLLKTYRSGAMNWAAYSEKYIEGLAKRNAERNVPLQLLEAGCLLCSEHEATFCHRRLAVEYLASFATSKPSISHLL
ncbi:hypothetical protein CQ050_14530 [Achromobacter sp. MYb9]|uniref:DUF488 domain-containing protein n=1 Tax=Achromobacter sp. MYb9 TaxID=1827284 RepID=UPI000CFC90EC|nr:DUF488 domain-containing protein [Achromobacter sp. MYb9]PQZ68519.1 hypothetical protein CQ050_14530 [Achromobacter sp. MYb9]